MADRKRIQSLNNREKIWYAEPRIETTAEVWFYVPSGQLRVWSNGTLHTKDRAIGPPRDPVAARHTLYKIANHLGP